MRSNGKTNVEDDTPHRVRVGSLPAPAGTKGGARAERYTFDIAPERPAAHQDAAPRPHPQRRKSFRSTRAKHSALPACIPF